MELLIWLCVRSVVLMCELYNTALQLSLQLFSHSVSSLDLLIFGRPYYRSRLWHTVSSVCLSSVTFCIQAKRLDRFAWNFQGRCGLTMGRSDYTLGQFGETARCRDTNFFVSNITRKRLILAKRLDRFAWNFQRRCGVTTGRPHYILCQFGETAGCRDTNFFVSNITTKRLILAKRLNRFARNFQGSCAVTTGRPHYILGQFGEPARCCDTNFFVRNITRKRLDRFA